MYLEFYWVEIIIVISLLRASYMGGNVQAATHMNTRYLPSKNLKINWETGSVDKYESTVSRSELIGNYSLLSRN